MNRSIQLFSLAFGLITAWSVALSADGQEQPRYRYPNCPSINYCSWDIGRETQSWSPGGSDQVSNINIFYRVELIANTAPVGKFVKVTNLGAGANPGDLIKDDDKGRGWFQEGLTMAISPEAGSGLVLERAVPETTPQYTEYSKTSGWNVGASSEGVFEIGFDSSTTSSFTIENFRIVQTSAGLEASWIYEMTSTGGNEEGLPYAVPEDLVNRNQFECGFAFRRPILRSC